VVQGEGLYVYNIHNIKKMKIVEKNLSISIAPVRSRGGSLVIDRSNYSFYFSYHFTTFYNFYLNASFLTKSIFSRILSKLAGTISLKAKCNTTQQTYVWDMFGSPIVTLYNDPRPTNVWEIYRGVNFMKLTQTFW
jgi:hypothetical protein